PSLIEDLARYMSGVRYAEMASADIAAVRRLVLDTVGCALGAIATDCQPAHELAGWLRMPSGPQDTATIIGSGQPRSLDSAMLYNGALVRDLDFMDVYWARYNCTPRDNIPAALAPAADDMINALIPIEANYYPYAANF